MTERPGFLQSTHLKPVRMGRPLKVFISYRRKDSLAAASVGRICDRLVERYGRKNVFIDVDTIPPGVRFDTFLKESLAQANVLLAVQGPQWTQLMQERQQDPEDFVRMEIELASQLGIPVVPVLVGGAEMPKAFELPAGLQGYERLNARQVDTGRDFNAHLQRLIEELEGRAGSAEGGLNGNPVLSWMRRFPWWIRAAIAGLIAVAGLGLAVKGPRKARDFPSPPNPPLTQLPNFSQIPVFAPNLGVVVEPEQTYPEGSPEAALMDYLTAVRNRQVGLAADLATPESAPQIQTHARSSATTLQEEFPSRIRSVEVKRDEAVAEVESKSGGNSARTLYRINGRWLVHDAPFPRSRMKVTERISQVGQFEFREHGRDSQGRHLCRTSDNRYYISADGYEWSEVWIDADPATQQEEMTSFTAMDDRFYGISSRPVPCIYASGDGGFNWERIHTFPEHYISLDRIAAGNGTLMVSGIRNPIPQDPQGGVFVDLSTNLKDWKRAFSQPGSKANQLRFTGGTFVLLEDTRFHVYESSEMWRPVEVPENRALLQNVTGSKGRWIVNTDLVYYESADLEHWTKTSGTFWPRFVEFLDDTCVQVLYTLGDGLVLTSEQIGQWKEQPIKAPNPPHNLLRIDGRTLLAIDSPQAHVLRFGTEEETPTSLSAIRLTPLVWMNGIRLRVEDKAGNPLDQGFIQVTLAPVRGGTTLHSGTGQFRGPLRLPAGEWMVKAVSQVFGTCEEKVLVDQNDQLMKVVLQPTGTRS